MELAVADAIQREDLVVESADFLRIEGKDGRRIIPDLDGATRKVDRTRIQPARRTRLESPYFES